ncbi:hypothetical protein GUJ93_ZPchr0012g21867 [Zizania palustris]|uniref:Uncharacterized protein n=1 Tax=Zizania palustris TaxID=103762 RepID=A0A8J6BSR6_ZIZPA|nr:hypothetical protein GUJ93_ZPchr0012g21867 [Zizania palustris]
METTWLPLVRRLAASKSGSVAMGPVTVTWLFGMSIVTDSTPGISIASLLINLRHPSRFSTCKMTQNVGLWDLLLLPLRPPPPPRPPPPSPAPSPDAEVLAFFFPASVSASIDIQQRNMVTTAFTSLNARA